MSKDIAELFEVAKAAAAAGAMVHRAALDSGNVNATTKSSVNDLVTEVDRESEQQIVAAIRKARPHDSIVGEEGTNVSGSTGVCWVLDPLDGTTNFVQRRLPQNAQDSDEKSLWCHPGGQAPNIHRGGRQGVWVRRKPAQ